MVADLVDHDMRDDLLEAERRGAPFVEDRAAVRGVMRSGSVPDCSTLRSVERHAFVEAAELDRMVEAERARRVGIGDRLDQQNDVAEAFARTARAGARSVRRAIASMSAADGIRPEGARRGSWPRH